MKTYLPIETDEVKNPEDVTKLTSLQLADRIKEWRESEDEFFDAACDLLNGIEIWLRNIQVIAGDLSKKIENNS